MDANGLPIRLGLTCGQAHDNRLCSTPLEPLPRNAQLLVDRGYDADWIRAFVAERGTWAITPPKRSRTSPICFSQHLYRDRNLVERFFNDIKHCRRVTTRMTNLLRTTSPSSNSRASACGYVFMSPRPSHLNLKFAA